MYQAEQKKFHVKPASELLSELEFCSRLINLPDRVFLADGDAMTLSYRRLKEVLEGIQTHLPNTRRVSAYCLPRNLKNKSVEELTSLRELGLELVYVGIESGDDEVLAGVRKGETYASTLAAMQKLKASGIKISTMVLNGLGGAKFSEQHAINSARLVSEVQPEYLSTLVLMLPEGEARMQEGFEGQFEPLTPRGLLEEMRLFLAGLELERSIFRSDHASNYMVLKGVLGRDKQMMLDKIDQVLLSPGAAGLRPEWARGL